MEKQQRTCENEGNRERGRARERKEKEENLKNNKKETKKTQRKTKYGKLENAEQNKQIRDIIKHDIKS